LRERPL
jgi:hypothetical protein